MKSFSLSPDHQKKFDTALSNIVIEDPSNIEECHCIKSSKIRLLWKGLKGMNMTSQGINSLVYSNDSLCTFYKMLWGKSAGIQEISLNKYIHSFWVTNGTIKLKTVENGQFENAQSMLLRPKQFGGVVSW